MTIWNAVLLGLVQGIAEILPISGSGHLTLVNNLFKLSNVSDGHMLFVALLRLATVISIAVVYWPELRAMWVELLSLANLGPYAGQKAERYTGARVSFMLLMATLPILLILPVNERLQKLGEHNVLIGVMLLLSGAMLYVADKMTPRKKNAGSMTVLDALIIGLCQCVAAIPGLSRSGATITAGIATGLKRDFAVHFSLLLSLFSLFGASLLAFGEAFSQGVDWSFVPAYLVGMAVALVTGIAAIHMLRIVASRGKFGGFAYYCWVVGVLTIILYLIF